MKEGTAVAPCVAEVATAATTRTVTIGGSEVPLLRLDGRDTASGAVLIWCICSKKMSA